jgi:hypothetical protein
MDAKWFGDLLGQAISGVTPCPVGTGQVGATFRFQLTPGDKLEQTPASLIGKFMSADPISRATGIAQSSYVREVNFYRVLHPQKPTPTPPCHLATIDTNSHEFALILGDFPDHRAGNQLEPASFVEAELAMRAGAQLHAAWWGDDALEAYAWLNGSHANEPMNIDALYTHLWPAFCARYHDRLNEAILSAGEAYVGRVNDWARGRVGPRCLVHGDFRPDNMLYNVGHHTDPIVIVDWQTAGVGNGATDIAYYLGTALSPDMRRQQERMLFDLWKASLINHGVPAGETHELWDVYRRDSVAGFLMGVLASMIVVQTPRGDDMFLEMCARSAVMIHDHRSYDLF